MREKDKKKFILQIIARPTYDIIKVGLPVATFTLPITQLVYSPHELLEKEGQHEVRQLCTRCESVGLRIARFCKLKSLKCRKTYLASFGISAISLFYMTHSL